MGFWKKLFGKEEQTNDYYSSFEEIDSQAVMNLFAMQMTDSVQRDKFVNGCLEQMKAASDEIDQLNREYDSVTAYLTDMEEIERIPDEMMNSIREYALRILQLEKERKSYKEPQSRMSDEQFALMQRLEDEMPQGYHKLKQSEDYQKLIKSDLNRIEGERQAYLYRQNELRGMLSNIRGVLIISSVAAATCFIMLLILQLIFSLDTQLGYLITVLALAITFTILFVKNTDYKREALRVEKSICKLIQLQNTVKIRYVNNVNLLDYLYMKFYVSSSSQLKELWDSFLLEKTDRERMEQTGADLDFYRKELKKKLTKLPIADPFIWMHQIEALVNHNELVEIRHAYIARRQKLRKQIDYNKEVAGEAHGELKELIVRYPQYSAEIMDKLSKFEKH